MGSGHRLELRIVFFLDQVHAAVRFRKQLLRSQAVGRVERAANADGNEDLAANAVARFPHGARQPLFQLRYNIDGDFGKDKDEFISTQPANLVVFPARSFELSRHFLEQLVSGQVAELIIHLLESIEVAEQHCQRSLGTPDAAKFLIKMQANGTRVGQAGEVIGAGGTLGLFVLDGVFDGDAELGTGRQKHAEMFLSEGILFTMVEREDTCDDIATAKGNAESRLQGGDA